MVGPDFEPKHKLKVPKVIFLYENKLKSTSEIAEETGIPASSIRNILIKNKVKLRSRSEGVGLVVHKISKKRTGVKRKAYTEQHKKNMSKAATLRDVSIGESSQGYLRILNKGKDLNKSAHIKVMEEFLGRGLRKQECVHHIDGDKKNNDIDNLCLLTKRGHARLHRYEDKLAGKERKRSGNGRFL